MFNGLGTPNLAIATLGNLKVGGNQEIIGYRSSGATTNTLEFTSVTLTGGNAIFTPRSTIFGAANQAGTFLMLGNIGESTPGSGIIMAGSTILTLFGNNTYSGNTTISNGTLALSGSASINNSPNINVGGGATFDVSGVTSSPYSLGSGQTLQGLAGTGTINGALALSASAGLTVNYTSGTPTLTVANGALTLNNNPVTVTVSGSPLTAGGYKLVSAGAAGSVAGSVGSSSLTVGGAGIAPGQHESLGIIGSELYLLVTNQAPVVANIVTNNVASGTTWKISILSLSNAAAWSDPDGDTVTLSSVTSPSANGTNVTSDANYIYYNGPVTAEDHFTYTVTDGHLTANGTVYVEAVASTAPGISNPAVNGSGHPTFSGHGIPGYTYGVESSTTGVNGPWSEAGTVTAGVNGAWTFTDASQTNPGMIFYRLYYPDNPGHPPQ